MLFHALIIHMFFFPMQIAVVVACCIGCNAGTRVLCAFFEDMGDSE